MTRAFRHTDLAALRAAVIADAFKRGWRVQVLPDGTVYTTPQPSQDNRDPFELVDMSK